MESILHSTIFSSLRLVRCVFQLNRWPPGWRTSRFAESLSAQKWTDSDCLFCRYCRTTKGWSAQTTCRGCATSLGWMWAGRHWRAWWSSVTLTATASWTLWSFPTIWHGRRNCRSNLESSTFCSLVCPYLSCSHVSFDADVAALRMSSFYCLLFVFLLGIDPGTKWWNPPSETAEAARVGRPLVKPEDLEIIKIGSPLKTVRSLRRPTNPPGHFFTSSSIIGAHETSDATASEQINNLRRNKIFFPRYFHKHKCNVLGLNINSQPLTSCYWALVVKRHPCRLHDRNQTDLSLQCIYWRDWSIAVIHFATQIGNNLSEQTNNQRKKQNESVSKSVSIGNGQKLWALYSTHPREHLPQISCPTPSGLAPSAGKSNIAGNFFFFRIQAAAPTGSRLSAPTSRCQTPKGSATRPTMAIHPQLGHSSTRQSTPWRVCTRSTSTALAARPRYALQRRRPTRTQTHKHFFLHHIHPAPSWCHWLF